jgi:hypothetical protein
MKYKVTKVYEVEAANKQEAVDKVVKDPNTLMYVSVTEVTNKGLSIVAREYPVNVGKAAQIVIGNDAQLPSSARVHNSLLAPL